MTKCFLPSSWIKVGPTQAYCPLPMAHVCPNMPPRSYQKALWAPMLFKQDFKMPSYPYHTVYTPPYRPWLMRVTKHVTTDVSKYVAPASLPPNRAFLTPSVNNLSTMCLKGLWWHLDEWIKIFEYCIYYLHAWSMFSFHPNTNTESQNIAEQKKNVWSTRQLQRSPAWQWWR